MSAELKRLKERAERAEARVAELEREVAALRVKPKYEEPMAKLVQVGPGQWKYAEEDGQ